MGAYLGIGRIIEIRLGCDKHPFVLNRSYPCFHLRLVFLHPHRKVGRDALITFRVGRK
ncbi:hypothetical protein D3C86_1928560 [compost metagenome]